MKIKLKKFNLSYGKR